MGVVSHQKIDVNDPDIYTIVILMVYTGLVNRVVSIQMLNNKKKRIISFILRIKLNLSEYIFNCI